VSARTRGPLVRSLAFRVGAILSVCLLFHCSPGRADDHTASEAPRHRPIAPIGSRHSENLKKITRVELETIKEEIYAEEEALRQFKLGLKNAGFPSPGFSYNYRRIIVPFEVGWTLIGMFSLFSASSFWESGNRRLAATGLVLGAGITAIAGLGTTAIFLSNLEIDRYLRQIPEIELWIRERKAYVHRMEEILNEAK
jgi:hypothetical protein